MGIIPVDEWSHFATPDNRDGLVVRPEQSALPVIEEHGIRLMQAQHSEVQRIALDSRVLIIEGISGSGKDTFQKYLKSKLRGRVVHDYSEGELLLSWNQRPIKDLFKMQIRLMRNFLDYVAVQKLPRISMQPLIR
jgi:hypothetical protein